MASEHESHQDYERAMELAAIEARWRAHQREQSLSPALVLAVSWLCALAVLVLWWLR